MPEARADGDTEESREMEAAAEVVASEAVAVKDRGEEPETLCLGEVEPTTDEEGLLEREGVGALERDTELLRLTLAEGLSE